eukprot:UN24924
MHCFARLSDDLAKLRKFCNDNWMWLHVEGDSTDLLLASSKQVPKSIQHALEYADSITVRPVEWFYIRAAKSSIGSSVCLTFLRQDRPDEYTPSPSPSTCEFTNIFPLWCQLQGLDVKEISTTADICLNLCKRLRKGMLAQQKLFGVKLSDERFSPSEIHFQIEPKFDFGACNLTVESFNKLLYDTVCKSSSIEVLQLEYNDFCNAYTFRPVMLDNLYKVTHENIDAFIEEIVCSVETVKNAMELRPYFKEQIEKIPDVNFVEAKKLQSSFVGLGAFFLVPSVLKENANEDSIAKLNEDLREKIKQDIPYTELTDPESVISIGACETLRTQKDVDAIIQVIATATHDIDFPKEVMDKMGSVILSGIQEAESRLEAPQSGGTADTIVRAVPIVGSVY